jgi:hypothetical protein
MGVANRLLPGAPDGGGRVAAGRDAAGEARSPLAPLVDAQARATHQYAAAP